MSKKSTAGSPQVYVYPEKLRSEAGAQGGIASMKFEVFERKGRDSIGTTARKDKGSLLDTIILYMPNKAIIPDSTSWDSGAELGMLGGAAIDAVKNTDTSSTANFLKSITGSLGNYGTDIANYALWNQASSIIQNLTPNLTTSSLMGLVGGKIPNPHVSLIFRGVNLRVFEFMFTFYPHNVHERRQIYQIIKAFRGYALPDAQGIGSGSILEYPPYFNIEYLYEGKKNEFLHNFKTCSLTGVNVDYTANGHWVSMRDGFPAATVLTLTFIEEEIVTRSEVFDDETRL